MEQQFLLEVDHLTTRGVGAFLLKDISFKVGTGQSMAVFGGTGSGKSTLLKCLKQYKFYPGHICFGGATSPEVVLIEHQHQFKNRAGMNNFYYQQRFNSSEADDTVTAMQDIINAGGNREDAVRYLRDLQIDHLINSPLICFSNGEHKRYQIAKALIRKADWLLLDNPFVGLDPEGRIMLERILERLLEQGTHFLMTTSKHVPGFITDVVTLEKGRVTGVYKRKDFDGNISYSLGSGQKDTAVSFITSKETTEDFGYAIEMKHVNVSYGGRPILRDINWEVKRGESWCISGKNGSGKSTLLSLVTGDNPQAFANDIYLFGRKRGTGETIWDIKRKIGFVSPEIHQYFDRSLSCFRVVASGLFDTIGLFRKLNDTQRKTVEDCMRAFQIEGYQNVSIGTLSNGMQRWVLLARAVIKNPPLFILDEPCQGLDEELTEKFISFVEDVCKNSTKTIIYVTHVDSEIPGGMTHFMKLEKGIIKEITENGKDHYGNTGRRDRA